MNVNGFTLGEDASAFAKLSLQNPDGFTKNIVTEGTEPLLSPAYCERTLTKHVRMTWYMMHLGVR
jgi:hypothetical protein